MILSYQQEELKKRESAKDPGLAWIGHVYTDGVTLLFGDGSAETQKHSKVITGHTYTAGMRVYVVKIGGEWLVVGPVGAP